MFISVHADTVTYKLVIYTYMAVYEQNTQLYFDTLYMYVFSYPNLAGCVSFYDSAVNFLTWDISSLDFFG